MGLFTYKRMKIQQTTQTGRFLGYANAAIVDKLEYPTNYYKC